MNLMMLVGLDPGSLASKAGVLTVNHNGETIVEYW